MATWIDLAGYVRSNYKIADERDASIKMIFDVGDLRSQVVLLSRAVPSGGSAEWLQIESPIGDVGSVDLQEVLERVGQMVCGGVVISEGVVMMRHAVPLLNLDINEFEQPLHMVTGSADLLEKKFVGTDKY